MSEQDEAKPNGATSPTPAPEPSSSPPARTLREVAEDAYDEVIEASDEGSEGGPEQPQVDSQGRTRDAYGRFVSKDAQPGEAEQPNAPSPEVEHPQPQDAHPAPGSSEPPANWSAEDRQTFLKLPQEGREFLLRRHSQMEGDYQRRVQANAAAAQFTTALAPVFNDPVISQSLRENSLSPDAAIREWAGMHRRAVSPNMQDRAALWHEMGQRMGLDPAAVYGQSQPGLQGKLSEADLKDPAIAYFADHVSKTVQEVQALRGQIVAMQQAEAQKTSAEAMKVTRWGIDTFAEEKDQQGNKLRPDFDTVLPQIIELFSVNPNRDLNEAYQTARRMNPQTYAQLVAAEQAKVQQQVSNQRARLAVRGNARGQTSPVSKPAPEAGKRSLRDMLEDTADEIGFG